jgi:SatD family (SatD)
MKKNDKYYVLLLDVVGSSRVHDRNHLTDVLTKIIAASNNRFSKECFSKFEITKGDEIAAVLRSSFPIYDMITFFGDSLAPVSIRSVAVFDRLSAGLNTRRSTIIDGPAFYTADKLMRRLKKTDKHVLFSTGQNDQDIIVESLMNLTLMKWYDLTGLQRTIIRLYQEERNQTKVAELLHKKQQQIQNTLSQCKWEILDQSEALIHNLCRKIDQKNKTTGESS